MAETVFSVLEKHIDAQIASAQAFLTAGSAKDYASYREIVGLIRGLEASKQYVEDLSRTYAGDDDDD